MGQCFLYGGGTGSGLKVLSGLSEPTNPKENMVWVKSDKAGKTFVFGETEPEAPADGLIWFCGSLATLKKASVYADNAWTRVDASVYTNGAWQQFSWEKRYLIRDGVPNVEFVANKAYLDESHKSAYTPTAPTIAGTTSDGYYRFYQSGGSGVLKAGIVTTKEPVPLLGFQELHVVGKTSAPSGYSQNCGLWGTPTPTYLLSVIASVNLPLTGQAEAEKVLDIAASADMTLYVGFKNYCYGTTANIWVKDLWLE